MTRQNLQFESSNLHTDLTQRMQAIDNLAGELLALNSKLNMAHIDLENMNRDDIVLNQNCADLSHQIARYTAERNETAARVADIHHALNDMFHSNESDRHQLELKRRWQSKLVTSKILQQTMERLQMARCGNAFQELRDYSTFDRTCH